MVGTVADGLVVVVGSADVGLGLVASAVASVGSTSVGDSSNGTGSTKLVQFTERIVSEALGRTCWFRAL